MRHVYIIMKIGFCNLENRIDAAIETTVVGATTDKELAEKLCEQYRRLAKPYEGWDKETYPRFVVKSHSVLDRSLLTPEDEACSAQGHRNVELWRTAIGKQTMVMELCLVCAQSTYRDLDEAEAKEGT